MPHEHKVFVLTTIYPLSPSSIRWLEAIFRNPDLQRPGGTVVRKISGAPRYVTQAVLAGVAKLKGCEVKIHGSVYLISRPFITAAKLVGSDAVTEAGILPYLMGKQALARR